MIKRLSVRLGLTALAAVAPLFFAKEASAQQNSGFAVNRFDPAEAGSDWFVNESLDFRGKLRPAFGVVGEWATDEIRFYNYDGSIQSAYISHQVYAHLNASVVLWERLRLGASLPLELYQTGQPSIIGNAATPTPSPDKAAIGNLRVGADLRLIGEYRGPFSASLGAQVHLPTGVQNQFTGDGAMRFVPRVAIAGDLAGWFVYSARIGYEVRGHSDSFAGQAIGDEVVAGGAFGLRVADKHVLVGPELNGATLASKMFKSQTSPNEVLLGVHYTDDGWRVGGGLGTGLNTAAGSPAFRMILGLEWSPPIDEDRDHDGINDEVDACPDTAGVKNEDPKKNGCPPPGDKDGDGVTDDVDACIDVAGVHTEDPKTNGCPAPIGDKDGDTVKDDVDACPDVAGIITQDPKTNGCPPPDKDRDGILDADDACPDVAGVKSDDPKKNGCPPPTDKDGDGITDDVDACPDTPGKADTDPKKNGCPHLVFIERGQIKITQQVKFKTGSAQILKESDEILGAVLATMNEHKEIKHVTIEGHTDNKGTAKANKSLSDKRAASVMAWLTLKGIPKDHLSSIGYGQEKPIDTNETDEGRANNRRVEFHIDEK